MDAETERRPRRTAPREERRQQLIDAAMAVIAERGLSGTTTAEVTGRAGLSLGLVNHHFETKDNLLREVLRHLAVELRDLWTAPVADPALSPAEKLAAIVDGLFHPVACTPTRIAVWFAFFGDAGYRDVYRTMVGEFDAERGQAIEALCRALKAEGDYAAVDPRALTQSIESMADGLWLGLMLYPDWISPAEAKARLVDLIAHHFPRHFAPEPGSGAGS